MSKGIVDGEILAAKVEPEKSYPVSYTIDQEGNKHYGEVWLQGKDLSETQIVDLYEKGLL